MRYVEFMEIKGGREIANFALDRSTKIFLKVLHVHSIDSFHVQVTSSTRLAIYTNSLSFLRI